MNQKPDIKNKIGRRLGALMLAALLGGAVAVPPLTASGYVSQVVAVAAAGKSKSKKSKSKKRSSSKTSAAKKKNTSSKKSTRKTSAKRKGVSKRWTAPQPAPVETPSDDSLTLVVNSRLLALIPRDQNPGGLRVNKVTPDHKSKLAKISLNDNFTYLPVTNELIRQLSDEVSQALPDSIKNYRVALNVGKHSLAYYITKVQPLPADARRNVPFVVQSDPYIHPVKGMEGDLLAVWHSHGRYYKPSAGSWLWQRPFLFQSVEDTYTMGYVLPFLVPMLENAGAYVMLPRERDVNTHEVIVDNDVNPDGQIYSQPYYKEKNGRVQWRQGDGEGFIYDLPDFRDTENPFENGTYRQVEAQAGGSPAVAAWYADIPEDGEYAVYVSYKSLPNSVPDAQYTVNYSGGSRKFSVNQKIGGSTWVYLGTFPLEKGYSDDEPVVTLTNLTSSGGSNLVVTADAVKIGGGMGNIARSPKRSDILYDPSTPEDDPSEEIAEDEESDDTDSELIADASEPEPEQPVAPQPKTKGSAPQFKVSGLPRYLEGARYWLHWAGFPDNVYSPYGGADDYKDDYTSRALWVNYLAGGSRVLPDDEGLGIPVDLTFALHSDAGKRADDSTVGTLGIYYTAGGGDYTDGTQRINSRMLTDLVMRQITNDVRRQWEPSWTRRSMWDKSYVEARIPEVPTTLIELLSHQNFADMQYGLDPAFKFTVARAIYKALGRFMAERKGRDFVVQPLPVTDFSIRRTGQHQYRLQWRPMVDSLESSAKPTRYIIESRSGDELGFHKIAETTGTHYDLRTADNEIHSFRIIAANEGGLAFASEVLAFREGVTQPEKPVLIVNGFTRVSGPEHFNDGDRAGFDSQSDFGVPYIRDISFAGAQTEFRRSAGESFGRSASDNVSRVIAGNTFDYPALHGESVMASGRGFVSCSLESFENGHMKPTDYSAVDLILGRQQTTITGKGSSGRRYQTFPERLRKVLSAYLDKGGKLMVTGENIASDATGAFSDDQSAEWLANTLGFTLDTAANTSSGRIVTTLQAPEQGLVNRSYTYSNTLNDNMYIVQHPDPLVAADGASAIPVLSFSDTDAAAGMMVKKGKGRVAALSVPFESISDSARRDALMKEILDWLDK